MNRPNAVSILQISDIHFESDPTSYLDDDKFYVDPSLRANVFRNAHASLKAFRRGLFDVIAVTGDITTAGKPAGFRAFECELVPAIRQILPDKRALCMVAGNHDVVWALNPEMPNYYDAKFVHYTRLVRKLKATTCIIPAGEIQKSARSAPAFAPTGSPIYMNAEKTFMILCINSSMRCGEINSRILCRLQEPLIALLKDDSKQRNRLTLELKTRLEQIKNDLSQFALHDVPSFTQAQRVKLEHQLRIVRDELADRWESLVKIAILHHHLVPFSSQRTEHKPFELMADSAGLLEFLAGFGFQIVLTGHKHQSYRQQFSFKGTELIVLGGPTLGGYPVSGSFQGMRMVRVMRDDHQIGITVAEVPCDDDTDVVPAISAAFERPPEYRLRAASSQGASARAFPARIDRAIRAEILEQKFYRKGMSYDITATCIGSGRLRFRTRLRYTVVNSTPDEHIYPANYLFSQGKVMRLRTKDRVLNENDLNPMPKDIMTARGVSIPIVLRPHEESAIEFLVEEIYPSDGTELYVSYYPCTDLRVRVREVGNIRFDLQPLHASNLLPKRSNGFVEMEIDNGVLPFQGVKLNWTTPNSPTKSASLKGKQNGEARKRSHY
jgi:3',5'-cyclic AMP phosphodiesterase CpdA